ncbi:MAG: VWA domain-containing protein [Planctomycetota bacterium]|nr:VWA domain-containing protein [Planctomycetota bacterium]
MKKGASLFLFLLLVIFPLRAQESPPAQPQPEGQADKSPQNKTSEKNLDIVFIMDDSGSMKETDAKEFRKLAVKAFLDLTQDRGGDSVAVVRFAGWQESIQEGFVICPLTQIPEEEEKRKEVLDKIKETIMKKLTASGTGTDFNFAFKMALGEILKEREKSERPLWLILLTDGEMYVRQEPGFELPDFYKEPLGNLPPTPKTLTQLALSEFENKVLPEIARIPNLYLTCINLLSEENIVLKLIAQKLNAKIIQGARENLKTVFLESLNSLPEGLYRPGITKGFGYLKLNIKPGETVESEVHLYQGTSVTKIVVFSSDSRFSTSLVDETGTVFPRGNEKVIGVGEEYQILNLKEIRWGDYKLIVKNESDKDITIERIIYTQFEIELALTSEEVPSVDAGDVFSLSVQMKDKRDNTAITDTALLKETDITVKVSNDEHRFRNFAQFSSGTSVATIKPPSDVSSTGGEFPIHIQASIIPETLFGGYAFNTPVLHHKIQIVAPVLHLTIPQKALQYQKLVVSAQIIKGSLNDSQKENGIKMAFYEKTTNKEIELLFLPKDGGLVAETVAEELGNFKLKDDRFDLGRVENKDVSLKVEERRLQVFSISREEQLIPIEEVKLEATEEQSAPFRLAFIYSLASHEEGEATVSFAPKRSTDAEILKIESPFVSGKLTLKPKETPKISLSLLAKEGLPADTGEIVVTAEVKGEPKTKLEQRIRLRFLVTEKPFPWWWIVLGAVALLTIILLLILTSRPVFEAQQLWYGIERRYILREFGKRSFIGTEESKDSLQIILKGSKKNPISYLKPLKSDLPVYVDDQQVVGYKALTHGVFIDIRVSDEEVLRYRFFEREPSVEEYMAVSHLPGEGEEYFLIVESEA